MKIFFLRHFETEVDPFIPVHDWKLSDKGRANLQNFMTEVPEIEKVYTSPEVKALEAAELIAEKHGVELEILEELAEVDRSGEGFIEEQERYLDMVQRYLKNEEVEFDWEAKSRVRKRFQAVTDEIDERALVITHGLFLAVNLSRKLDEDPHLFWDGLGFGELLEIDADQL